MILLSKGYRMNMMRFGAIYGHFDKNFRPLYDESKEFKETYKEFIKQELIKNNKWDPRPWAPKPIGEIKKWKICVSYNLKILNEEITDKKFNKALKLISKKSKRILICAFVKNENTMIICLSKLHIINKKIIIDRWIDNFNNEFIQNLNKEICE